MIRLIRRPWSTNSKGNITVLFAFLLLPLFLMIGFSIDMMRQVSADQQVQTALDAAALAGSRALQNEAIEVDAVKTIANSTFLSNLSTAAGDLSCETMTASVDKTAKQVGVSVTCAVPLIFPRLSDSPKLFSFKNTASSQIGLNSIDVALMLDMSQSMNDGTRLADLQAAAKALAATVLTDETRGRVRIALAPYGDAVNAGAYGSLAQGKAMDDDSDGDGAKVCVSRRKDTGLDYTDAAPAESLYVGDRVGSNCDDPMILPLSGDLTTVTDAIDGMSAKGQSTAGHLGLAWSWYLLSPKWGDIWPDGSKPNAYDASNTSKVIIMMTDGGFNKYHDSNSPWVALKSAKDARKFCTSIHAEGVLVFAVGLDVPDAPNFPGLEHYYSLHAPKALLSYCAGDPSRYHEVSDSSELSTIYADIAELLKIEVMVLTD